MTEELQKAIMWFILVKLKNMRKWGASHSELKRVLKSLPNSCKDKKLIERAVNNLVNLGFVIISKKTGEDHISLNPRKAKEINHFIIGVKDIVGDNQFLF